MKQWGSDEELFDTLRRDLFTAVVGYVMDTTGLLRRFLPPQIKPLHDDMVVIGRALTVLEANLSTESRGTSGTGSMSEPFGLMFQADTGGPRVFLLTGKPGSGKTAISRRLTEFWHDLSVPDGLLVFPRNFLSAAYFCSARAAFESISESSPDPSPFSLPDETEVFRYEDFVTEGGRGAT